MTTLKPTRDLEVAFAEAAHLDDQANVTRDQIRAGIAAVLAGAKPADPADIEAAVLAERQRIKDLLAIPFLQALRLIPDGTVQNGCIVSDGAVARERARHAWLAIDGQDEQP